LWGLLDVVFVGTFMSAGLAVWHGRQSGNVKGLVIATSSTLRWLLHLPASPAVSVMVIVMNVATISCLWAQSAYFRAPT
jgi:hypothetical protein